MKSRCRNHSRARVCRRGWVRTSSYHDSTAYSRQKLTPAVPCRPLHTPSPPALWGRASICIHFRHPSGAHSGPHGHGKWQVMQCKGACMRLHFAGPSSTKVRLGKIMPHSHLGHEVSPSLCVLCPGSIAFLRGGGRAEARVHSCTPTISAYPALFGVFLEKE